jgi:hypothetical protein
MCFTSMIVTTLGMNCANLLMNNMNMFFSFINQFINSIFGVISGTGIVSGQGYPGFY